MKDHVCTSCKWIRDLFVSKLIPDTYLAILSGLLLLCKRPSVFIISKFSVLHMNSEESLAQQEGSWVFASTQSSVKIQHSNNCLEYTNRVKVSICHTMGYTLYPKYARGIQYNTYPYNWTRINEASIMSL